MNIFASTGVAVGILVGLIVAVIVVKFANTNHKFTTEYDERQKELRGRGYMFGFYAIVIYECVMLVLGIGKIPLPVDDYLIHFGGILTGVTVLCVYCIWKGIYFGLNNDRKRYAVVFVVITALNAVPVIRAAADGTLVKDGQFSLEFLNLMILVMVAVIGVTLLVRSAADRIEGEA